MIQLGALVLWLGLALSPVLVPVLLLNRRDRKESALLGALSDQLSAPDLRGRIAVRVRGALLGRAGVVALDMRDCSRDEVWEVMTRLSRSLPSHARLVVDGLVDRQVPATFALEAADRPLAHSPRRLLPTSWAG